MAAGPSSSLPGRVGGGQGHSQHWAWASCTGATVPSLAASKLFPAWPLALRASMFSLARVPACVVVYAAPVALP